MSKRSNKRNTSKSKRPRYDELINVFTDEELMNDSKKEEAEEEAEEEEAEEKKDKETKNKERSHVWTHFEKFIDDDNITWAKCLHCG